MDEDICPKCKQPVKPGQPRNGVTGEHWTCYRERKAAEPKKVSPEPTRAKAHKDPAERYRRWWLGKLCRLPSRMKDFKRVTVVRWIGNDSGFSGIVELTFEDGTTELVSGGINGYKPRKFDIEVKEESFFSKWERVIKSESDSKRLK